jgi:hypothetical protein
MCAGYSSIKISSGVTREKNRLFFAGLFFGALAESQKGNY